MARRSRGLNFLRLVFSLVVFVLSLLAVFPAPTYLAWELSVLVTEWGYILALVSLLFFLPGWKRSLTGRTSRHAAGCCWRPIWPGSPSPPPASVSVTPSGTG